MTPVFPTASVIYGITAAVESRPLPRVLYNYSVLHDADVEEVQDREIMPRLSIYNGTFNRTRRNAIRGLARLMVEKRRR